MCCGLLLPHKPATKWYVTTQGLILLSNFSLYFSFSPFQGKRSRVYCMFLSCKIPSCRAIRIGMPDCSHQYVLFHFPVRICFWSYWSAYVICLKLMVVPSAFIWSFLLKCKVLLIQHWGLIYVESKRQIIPNLALYGFYWFCIMHWFFTPKWKLKYTILCDHYVWIVWYLIF